MGSRHDASGCVKTSTLHIVSVDEVKGHTYCPEEENDKYEVNQLSSGPENVYPAQNDNITNSDLWRIVMLVISSKSMMKWKHEQTLVVSATVPTQYSGAIA